MKLFIWLLALVASISTTIVFQFESLPAFLCGIVWGFIAILICELID